MNTVRNEPVLAIAGLIAAVLLIAGIKADVSTITVTLETLLPIVGGLLARAHVTPTFKVPPVVTEVVDDLVIVAGAAQTVAHVGNKPAADDVQKTDV